MRRMEGGEKRNKKKKDARGAGAAEAKEMLAYKTVLAAM